MSEPLIPPPPLTGRPHRDPREMWNAIFWVPRRGAPWRDLPERHGPWESAHAHFNPWRRQGVFERVLEALQVRLAAEGHIDLGIWCVDGSSVRASKAAAGAGEGGLSRILRPRPGPLARWIREQAPPGG